MARNRKKKRGSAGIGAWLLAGLFGLVLIAIMGGIGLLYYTAQSAHVELDDRLCPLAGPQASVVVLVDTTDTLASLTRGQLTSMVADAARATPKGALFEIRTLRTDEPYTTTLLSLCNPGDGSDLTHLTGAPGLALQRWKEGFEAPLADALSRSMTGETGNTSPIMAGIQAIAVAHLTAEADRRHPARLVVISDMLENTARFSHYRAGTDFEAYRTSEAARHYATDLAGKDLELWVVQRNTGKISSIQLVEFWRRWAEYNRGRFAGATALQGISD